MITDDEIATARCTAALRTRIEAAGLDLGDAVRFDDLLDRLFAHFAAACRAASSGLIRAKPPGPTRAPKAQPASIDLVKAP